MQRIQLRAALTTLLLAALMMIPLTARAESATLRARFDISSSSVSITGTLTADGRGLAKETVLATLDGGVRAEAVTKGNGSFSMSFQLPRDLAAGTHEVAAVFRGSRAADAARAATTFTIAGQPRDEETETPPDPGDPGDPGSSPDPQPTEDPITPASLEVSGPTEAINGSLLSLDGRLSTESGGVGNAGINVSDNGGEVDDSFTVTEADGTFSTFYFVPEDTPSGTLTLRLSFAGTSTLSAASTQLTVAVEHREPVTESPSPSPSPTASPSPTPSVSASATPTSGASPSPVMTEAVEDVASPMNGFLIAAAGVAAVGIITASVLVYRGVHGHHLGDEERSLDVFDDGPPPPASPRHG